MQTKSYEKVDKNALLVGARPWFPSALSGKSMRRRLVSQDANCFILSSCKIGTLEPQRSFITICRTSAMSSGDRIDARRESEWLHTVHAMIKTFVSRRHSFMLRKVPEITLMFWLVKLLTTALGEVFSDSLMHHFDPIIVISCSVIGLLAALFLQFAVHKYIPAIYWSVVVMVAIFGTMAADVLHTELGISYAVSTLWYVGALVGVFSAWYRSEKTLSIHSINTVKREMFYWATVLITFALGTAAGDMMATTVHLGYFSSAIFFAVLILLSALAHWRFGLNSILSFWIAYVLTRPLGASLADWAEKSHRSGGLGIGAGWVNIVLLALIILSVSYLSFIQPASTHRNARLR